MSEDLMPLRIAVLDDKGDRIEALGIRVVYPGDWKTGIRDSKITSEVSSLQFGEAETRVRIGWLQYIGLDGKEIFRSEVDGGEVLRKGDNLLIKPLGFKSLFPARPVSETLAAEPFLEDGVGTEVER